MRKFGVKLFSNNFIEFPDVTQKFVEAIEAGKFDYLELMALPDSYETCADVISKQVKGRVKCVIHAPHSSSGMDTGNAEAYENNRKLLYSAQKFADLLESPIIILHPGSNLGEKYLEETVRQFNKISDKRIAVENLPKINNGEPRYFHACTPKEIARIKAETGCKFCYDFCHGICASNSFGTDKFKDIEAYVALKPDMYHMCDNDINEENDLHMHYAEGSYDLAKLLNEYTDKDAIITMETGVGVPQNIEPWLEDVRYLRSMQK